MKHGAWSIECVYRVPSQHLDYDYDDDACGQDWAAAHLHRVAIDLLCEHFMAV